MTSRQGQRSFSGHWWGLLILAVLCAPLAGCGGPSSSSVATTILAPSSTTTAATTTTEPSPRLTGNFTFTSTKKYPYAYDFQLNEPTLSIELADPGYLDATVSVSGTVTIGNGLDDRPGTCQGV